MESTGIQRDIDWLCLVCWKARPEQQSPFLLNLFVISWNQLGTGNGKGVADVVL